MQADGMVSARDDWELYLQLTHELKKFIDREDVDEFISLVDQRAALVERLKKNEAAEAYRQTETARRIAAEVAPLDREILYKAKAWLNKSRRQNAAVRNYDLTELTIEPAGNILNRKY